MLSAERQGSTHDTTCHQRDVQCFLGGHSAIDKQLVYLVSWLELHFYKRIILPSFCFSASTTPSCMTCLGQEESSSGKEYWLLYSKYRSRDQNTDFWLVNIFRHSAAPQPWVVGKSLNDSLEDVKIKCDAEEASSAPPTQGWRSVSCFLFPCNFISGLQELVQQILYARQVIQMLLIVNPKSEVQREKTTTHQDSNKGWVAPMLNSKAPKVYERVLEVSGWPPVLPDYNPDLGG